MMWLCEMTLAVYAAEAEDFCRGGDYVVGVGSSEVTDGGEAPGYATVFEAGAAGGLYVNG